MKEGGGAGVGGSARHLADWYLADWHLANQH